MLEMTAYAKSLAPKQLVALGEWVRGARVHSPRVCPRVMSPLGCCSLADTHGSQVSVPLGAYPDASPAGTEGFFTKVDLT